MSALTVEDLEAVYQDAIAVRQARKDARNKRPLIRLWDGNWDLRGICTAEISADFKWLLNESGTGVLELPADHFLAKWIMRPDLRDTEAVHITVDKDGARWDGRMSSATLKKTATGLLTVVVTFMHSYQELKFFQAWCNPFLPSAFQAPRRFLLGGPSAWTLKLSLKLQVLRKETFLSWSLPEDPLELASWLGLNQSNWSIVVAPGGFWDDTSQWGLVSSRFNTWHDMAADLLEDAQLMVTTRRWLEGDPEPWEGADLRNGCLVVDVVDKSGYFSETSTGGTVLDGLVRTFGEMADDFLESTEALVGDPTDDPQYLISGWLGTRPTQPWVVYREGRITGIETSEFTINPATAVQINVGGKSAPGVNEGIQASVILAGNLIGSMFMQSGMGSVADAVLNPIYSDTVLAWMTYKSMGRASRLGWSHYFESMQSAGDRAYTLSALASLRAGLWATRSFHTHKLTIRDAAPYLVGENGQGHFFLGDRIGSTVAGQQDGKVFVDQVTAITLSWKRGQPAAWQVSIGSDRDLEDGVAKALKSIQKINSELHDLGVF